MMLEEQSVDIASATQQQNSRKENQQSQSNNEERYPCFTAEKLKAQIDVFDNTKKSTWMLIIFYYSIISSVLLLLQDIFKTVSK